MEKKYHFKNQFHINNIVIGIQIDNFLLIL